MLDYSTDARRRQEADGLLEMVLGEGGEIVLLDDARYPHKDKHLGSLRLADLYRHLGFAREAELARTCATALGYDVHSETGERRLSMVNACKLRLCPWCAGRRAHKAAVQLIKALLWVDDHRADVRYLMLTVTLENCTAARLVETLTAMTDGWSRLRKLRGVKRAALGWYRTLEITRNHDDNTYHPHIHVLIAVDDKQYFHHGGAWIDHADWVRMWRESARLPYNPIVGIQVAHAHGDKTAGLAAALESSKYSTKDKDYIDPSLSLDEAAQVVQDYTKALHRRRLIAKGGIIADAYKALALQDVEAEDADLVHAEDEPDLAGRPDLVEVYRWARAIGDYVLSERRPWEPRS